VAPVAAAGGPCRYPLPPPAWRERAGDRSRRIFSRAEPEKRLAGLTARIEKQPADAAYLRENILVRSIEQYAFP
jgi:hypothetical protein